MTFPSLLAAADRAALAHLGGAVRYVPFARDPVDVRGVFDNTDANATVQGQEVMSSGPKVFLRLADLPTDPDTEQKGFPHLVIDGVEYSTRDIAKDGMGGVMLSLNEAA